MVPEGLRARCFGAGSASPQQPVQQLCDQQDFGVTLEHPLSSPLLAPAGAPLACGSSPLLYCILACPGTYCRYKGWRLLLTNSIGTTTALHGDGSVLVNFSFCLCDL